MVVAACSTARCCFLQEVRYSQQQQQQQQDAWAPDRLHVLAEELKEMALIGLGHVF